MDIWVDLITILLGVGGIIGGMAGIGTYIKTATEKNYASQRDFMHLLRNQEQLINNLSFQAKEVDARFASIERTLTKIEAILITWRGKNGDSD